MIKENERSAFQHNIYKPYSQDFRNRLPRLPHIIIPNNFGQDIMVARPKTPTMHGYTSPNAGLSESDSFDSWLQRMEELAAKARNSPPTNIENASSSESDSFNAKMEELSDNAGSLSLPNTLKNAENDSFDSWLQKMEELAAKARNSSPPNIENAGLDRPDEQDDCTDPIEKLLRRTSLKLVIPARSASIESMVSQTKGYTPLPKSRHFLQAKEQKKGCLAPEQGEAKLGNP
ncbi:hypothetical protein F4820DRAFT_440952 [Hypoxylon rubiginosum]|uniref:Uncharacterized protein n=1 Tax=Hypoxylon rubiginosum TaxID=110542 RepID=A0ACB9YJK9_9PEZI|nr:hypothetical protein F4820DRAFT_440952 [Hypoxylon rubiginosum]